MESAGKVRRGPWVLLREDEKVIKDQVRWRRGNPKGTRGSMVRTRGAILLDGKKRKREHSTSRWNGKHPESCTSRGKQGRLTASTKGEVVRTSGQILASY